jgi:2-polyprenyl-3-methyl-5-hydroxy-6-metoxy-1,4-benzoquinol methylase
LEEYAEEQSNAFDVAFCVFVMEHVARPAEFVDALARVLRPGGTFLALTLNQWHYFGLTTLLASRLGGSEWLLRHVRDAEAVHEYHHRTEYRINSIRSTVRHLERAGFASAQFRVYDAPAMYEPYLPGPLTRLASVWSSAAYGLGRPSLMGHLTYKAVLHS